MKETGQDPYRHYKTVMELYIETLTGTAFELRVSPFETIASVKSKIQRLEGIPIQQQHLIWNSVELDDEFCLHDYRIHDGATLKLVLAMRGGPINTRRIPTEDPSIREMAEYMEANRDEILDKLPNTSKQVTLLVFREGDQLNFFRVVDKKDGSLSPLSESLSGASVYNLGYDDDEEEDVPSKEKVEENEKTNDKMRLLKQKMNDLSLNKKPKRKPTLVPRPPSTGRPNSRSRFRVISGSSSKPASPSFATLNKNPCLPPVGCTEGVATQSPAAYSPATLSLLEDTGEELADVTTITALTGAKKRLDSAKALRSIGLERVLEDQAQSSSGSGTLEASSAAIASSSTLDAGTQSLPRPPFSL